MTAQKNGPGSCAGLQGYGIRAVEGCGPDPLLYLERNGDDVQDINGTHVWRTEFFYEHPRVSRPHNIPSSSALVRKDFKYVAWPQWDTEQLFDLRSDPLEQNDIFADPKYANLVVEMRKRHNELQEGVK